MAIILYGSWKDLFCTRDTFNHHSNSNQNMQTLNQKIVDHFNRYTNANVVFVAGDRLFLSASAAESYGQGLVKMVSRTELQNYQETLTVEAIQQMNYNQLKDKVAELGLEVVDKKKNNLKDALLAFVNQK